VCAFSFYISLNMQKEFSLFVNIKIYSSIFNENKNILIVFIENGISASIINVLRNKPVIRIKNAKPSKFQL